MHLTVASLLGAAVRAAAATSTGYVTLVSPPGTTLVNVAAIADPSPSNAPGGVSSPFGFFQFAVRGLAPGAPATVQLIDHTNAAVTGYYKYSSTSSNPAGHWYEYAFDGSTGAQIVGKVTSLAFVDGGRGDDDLAANGRLTDPRGPAFLIAAPTTTQRFYLCGSASLCVPANQPGLRIDLGSGGSWSWSAPLALVGDGINGTRYKCQIFVASLDPVLSTTVRADIQIGGEVVASTSFTAGAHPPSYSRLVRFINDGVDPSVTGTTTVELRVTHLSGGNPSIIWGGFPFDQATENAHIEIPGEGPIATPTPTRTPMRELTPRALFLDDSAAAKAAVKCQQAFEKSGAKLTAARLTALGRCSGSVLRCIQTKPGDPSCTSKAGAACVKALAALGDAAGHLRTSIDKACFAGPLAFDQVLDASGLGHDANTSECGAGFGVDVTGPDTLASCIARQQTCRSEQLFAFEEPRAQEALRVGEVSAALRDALACLPDRGGAGADVGDPGGTGKAVVACAAAPKKAGAAFVANTSRSLASCLDAVFTCVQTQPVTPACFTKAEAGCAKAFTKIASEEGKLARALAKKCSAIDFTTLAASDAAGFTLLAGDCAAFGVTSVDSLKAYTECLVRQHECEVENLVRFRAPRATELLALVGQGLRNGSCPVSLPLPTPTMTVPATATPTRSATPTLSGTPTGTATHTPTPPTPSATHTTTRSPTPTPGTTLTIALTASVTITANPSTPTASPTPLATLSGPAGDPANDHLPDLALPDPPPEDLVAPHGIPISVRDLLLVLADGTTVADANALLQSLPAGIAGGNPAGGLLLVRLTGTSDLARVLGAQATLGTDARVAAVSINMGRSPERLPPTNVVPANSRWTWEIPLVRASGNWGLKTIRMPQAWNLFDYAARVSHARFADAVRPEALILESDENSGNTLVSAGHVDLAPNVQTVPGFAGSNHATMVGGIVSALWGNNAGVEGVNPRPLTIHSRGSQFSGSLINTLVRALTTQRLARVANNSAGWSATYAGGMMDPVTALVNPTAPAGPANPTQRQQVDTLANTLLTSVTQFVTSAGGRSDFLFFCSAGNTRLRFGTTLDYQARDNSECANLASRFANPDPASPLPVGPADHFLAVEAMDATGARSSFSAAFGTVSAPGTCVRSSELNDGVNYDSGSCTATDTTDQNYATASGTSFASPHAAGLAAYLWSLDPDLTYLQMRQILTNPANAVAVPAGPLGGNAGAQRIDSFATALGIDLARGNTALQRALVDVDDGTRDGNLRVDPLARQMVTAIDTMDHRRGDGQITMRDFRAWRDAYLQVHAAEFAGSGLSVALDGPPTHFKKDLNLDGCVGQQAASPGHPLDVPQPPAGCANAPSESVYPRYDFNGDGQVGAWFATAPFKVDPDAADPDAPVGQNKSLALRSAPGFLRDIDVLADANMWTPDHENVFTQSNVEGVPPGDPHDFGPERYLLGNRDPASAPAVLKALPDYIHSFDLHIRIDWSRVDPDYEGIKVTVTSEMQSDFAAVFEQQATIPYGADPSIVTIPLWTGRVKVALEGIDNEMPNPVSGNPGFVEPTTLQLTGVSLAEDRAIDFPRFPAKIADLAPHHAALAADALGGVYVVYEQRVSADSNGNEFYDHYLASSLDGGVTFTSQPTVMAVNEQRRPTALAIGPSGTLYLANVFGNPSDPAPLGNAAVGLSVSPDAGQTLLAPVPVSTAGTTNVDFYTDVAVDSFERVYMVWAESGTDSGAVAKKNPFMIRMRTSDDLGATLSAPITIHADANPTSRWFPRGTQVAVTPGGEVHVTWTECLTTSGNCSLFRLLYSRSVDGVSFSAPVEVAQNEFLAGFYEMTVDADGNVSVVYSTNGFTQATVKYVRIENGVAVRTVDVSQTPSGQFATHTRVAVDAAGNAWVTWMETLVPQEEIYVARTTDGGLTFDARVNVSESPPRPSGAPAIAIDPTGMPVLTWGEKTPNALLFRPLFVQ